LHGIPDIILKVGSTQIDVTIEIMTLFVMSFLIIIALFIRIEKFPGKIQNVLEIIISFLNNLAVDMIGSSGKQYVPLVSTLFFFILLSNWMGLIPGNLFTIVTWIFGIGSGEFSFTCLGIPCEFQYAGLAIQPPTANINTPLALAIAVVIYYNYCGIKAIGLKKYLLHYLGPVPELIKDFSFPLSLLLIPLGLLFLLLNTIEHFSRTFSLTVRLFCNIMGEHSVLAALIVVILEMGKMVGSLSVIVLPIFDIIPLVVMGIGIVTGAVQAFIFSLLTLSYIASVAGEHH